ncbi:MAG: type II toxin-antitoxin system HicA family toxin [Planctomycetes bacterium]|nr:type II toxin-antitoxin system HicA family toxin [Planctomycetota bacterium]
MKAMGAIVEEREGSRVCFYVLDEAVVLHKPHPGNEIKKYVVDDLRAFFKKKGVLK